MNPVFKRTLRLWIVASMLWCWVSGAIAQESSELASLHSALSITADDSSKIMSLNNLAHFWSGVNNDSAFHYVDLAIAESNQTDDYWLQHSSILQLGRVYTQCREYEKSDSIYLQLIARAEEKNRLREKAQAQFWAGHIQIYLDNDEVAAERLEASLKLSRELDWQENEIFCLIYLGMCYNHLGLSYKSVEHYEEALQLARITGDSASLGRIYMNYGNVLDDIGEQSKSLYYYKQSLRYDREQQDTLGIGMSLINIGSRFANDRPGEAERGFPLFFEALEMFEAVEDSIRIGIAIYNIGNLYYFTENYDTAQQYYFKAIEIYTAINTPNRLFSPYFALGLLNQSREDYDEGLRYYHRALDIVKNSDNRIKLAKVYQNIGLCHRDKGEFEEAENWMNKSVEVALEAGQIHKLPRYFENLAKISVVKGDFEQAYSFMVESKLFSDSAAEKSSSEELERLKVQFETERKDRKNLQLQLEKQKIEAENVSLEETNDQQNQQLSNRAVWIIALVILVLLLAFAAYWIIQRNRLRSQVKILGAEQKLLRTQMNPHFLFNALIAIQGYMEENDAEEAGQYLAKFSNLTRQILEYSRRDYITIEEEITLLKHYLTLQQLRYGSKFEYQIKMDETFVAEYFQTLPMLLQPIVENAIEHGFNNMDSGGRLELEFVEEKDNIVISVRDNGVGIKGSSYTEMEHHSLSSTITRERIDLFNETHNRKIRFKVEANDKGAGTLAQFWLPIPLHESS